MLEPLLFVLYTADVCDIAAAAHGMNAHSYPDDVELYTHCLPRDQHAAVSRFTTCLTAIILDGCLLSQTECRQNGVHVAWLSAEAAAGDVPDTATLWQQYFRLSKSPKSWSYIRPSDGTNTANERRSLFLPFSAASIEASPSTTSYGGA